MSEIIASQAIAGQTIVGWAIGGKKARLPWRKKNNRLIGKKPPNSVRIKEENQGRKELVVVQSSKINFCDQ